MSDQRRRTPPKLSGLISSGIIAPAPISDLPEPVDAVVSGPWFNSLPRSKRGNLVVPVSQLRLSPHQSRHVRTEERIEEVKLSLSDNGQIEPITVYPGSAQNEGFLLVISGGTRLEACRRLGWTTLEAQIDEAIDPNDALGIVRISTIHNNTAVESDLDRAYTVKNLLDMNFTTAMIASAIGAKSARDVNRLLSFFKLPPSVLELGARNPAKFSATFCEVLNTAIDVVDEEGLRDLLKNAFTENWSFRELERSITMVKRQKTRNVGSTRSRSRRLVLQEYKTSNQKLGHLNILDMGNGKQRIELDATLDHELAVQVREKIELMFSSIIAEVEQSKAGNES